PAGASSASGLVVPAPERVWLTGPLTEIETTMRLPGRLAAAISVLTDVETRKRPVSEALKAWGLNNRFAGAGDRAAIGHLGSDAWRGRASHAALLGRGGPRALLLAVAGQDWKEVPAALNASFAGDNHAPEA